MSISTCRMPWNFLWKSPGLPRPLDPFSETLRFQVYNVTEEESKSHRIIAATNKKSGEPFVYHCTTDEEPFVYDCTTNEDPFVHHCTTDEEPFVYLCTAKIGNNESYELLVKKEKNRYSLARISHRREAMEIYNRLKFLILGLIPYGPKSKMPEVAAFLQELVLFSNRNKEYGVVHLAARMGLDEPFVSKVPLFIKKLNERIDPLKKTPLFMAILSGREETVAAILSLNPNLKLMDCNNSSALHYAASSSNPNVSKLVLNYYHKNYGFEYLRKKNNHGLTPFHLACYSERRENVVQFLELKLPIDILSASRPANLYRRKEGVKKPPERSVISNTEEVKKQLSERSVLLETEEVKKQSSERSVPRKVEEVERQEEKRVEFTQQMMEDVEWSEMKLGGTPLHWVRRRRTLDVFLEYQFPKESLNLNEESVIHVMVRKKRLGCLMILLSNGYSPNVTGRRRLAPLHYAILELAGRRLAPLHYAILEETGTNEISLLQLLAVYDADLNATYFQSPRHVTQTDLHAAYLQSPRHMTQNILDLDVRNLVLHILHTLGASRCPRKVEETNRQKGCFDACEPGGTNNGQPYKTWTSLEGQTLYTKYLIENIVRNRPRNGQKRLNMLCCDGGGTRGVLAAQMLVELQKYLKRPVHEYFDWLSGTSTGSLIASSLAMKRRAEDIRRDYVTLKDDIFAGERPYSTSVVEKFLKTVMPPGISMGDIKGKKLIITAVQADCSPVQLHFFRNYPPPDEIASSARSQTVHPDLRLHDQSSNLHSDSRLQNQSSNLHSDPRLRNQSSNSQPDLRLHNQSSNLHSDPRLQNSSDVPLWFACRASGAAPGYFKPADVYIDGGLIANNPTLDTMTEFYMYNKAMESVGRKEETQVLGSLLSLGTGRWPIVPQEPLNVGRMTMRAPRQSYNQAVALVTTLSIVSSMTDNYIVDRAQAWCSTLNVPYFRLSPPISQQLPLDVKHDADLVNAMYETKAYCYHLREDFKLLASVLEESLEPTSSLTSSPTSSLT